jgi:hypothetical protein
LSQNQTNTFKCECELCIECWPVSIALNPIRPPPARVGHVRTASVYKAAVATLSGTLSASGPVDGVARGGPGHCPGRPGRPRAKVFRSWHSGWQCQSGSAPRASCERQGQTDRPWASRYPLAAGGCAQYAAAAWPVATSWAKPKMGKRTQYLDSLRTTDECECNDPQGE